ncbi:peptidylprolyl isomerase [Paenibacillus chitinolyticus]|uniref:peptidylprolyl isomerase n=1 Tax=Paenibacillus chitinolyticus TaxID=79263 RepID=UPI003869B590
MHNVKVLWGAILALSIGVIVLLSLQLSETGLGKKSAAGGRSGETPADGHIVARITGREFTQGELTEKLTKHYGAEMLNQMLDRETLRLEAQEQGVDINEAEISRELKRMQQGYENEQNFYDSMKEQLGMNREDVREDVLYKLLLEKLATHDVEIADDRITKYIQGHPDEFKQTAQIHLHKMVVSTLDQAKKAMAAYQGGESFATLARDRSLDDSGSQGGDLGWMQEDDPFQPAEIMKAARKLGVGQLSAPIKTAGGYALILITEKKMNTGPDEAAIRESVRKQLALQEAPPLNEYLLSLRQKWKATVADPGLNPNS